MIKVRNLNKVISGIKILDDMNLTFENGKIYGLQGKNGSGKTMLLRAICGLIKITEGEIIIDGKRLGKDIMFPDDVGILIENPSFINKYTGFKNLKLIAEIQNKVGDEEINSVIRSVGLNPDDRRTYRKYSLGMRQRLGIACAVMGNPGIVLLDEPFNALDEAGIEQIRNLIYSVRDSGSVVIIACHDREELESLSDEIFLLNDGKIVKHYEP